MSGDRDARRLSFGHDDELIDVVCAGAGRILDVGCGTGIAARLMAARGCAVLGVEADERMAAVARASGVTVDVSPFETWTPPSEPFDVVASAQAWQWIDPAVGPHKAADVLKESGRLALFWNGYEDVELRDEISDVYRRPMRRWSLGALHWSGQDGEVRRAG